MTAYPKLPRAQNRRIKLAASQREDIKARHKAGMGIRALARAYGVDKRLIGFIIYPERAARNKQLRAERGGSAIYYDREKHRLAMQRYRKHKNEVQGEAFKAWRRENRTDKRLPGGW